MSALIEAFAKNCRRCATPAMTVPYALWGASLFLLSVLTSSVSQSDEHRVERASVLERGIFQAHSGGPPVGHSSLGPVTKVRDASLVQSTTTIPARRSLRFGLRYVIVGDPVGARAKIQLVTRFPEAGLLDPLSGLRYHHSEYTIQGVIGAPAYREFRFDRLWEIVPGEWVFEFWHAGRKIGLQKFCVMDAESPPHESGALQGENCALLMGRASSGVF